MRNLAVALLAGVLDRRQPLDRAVEAAGGRLAVLEPRDRGFVLSIVRAALRRHRFLAAVLARLVERPLLPEARRTEFILLCGAAQILLLGTPPHAAVDLAVEQTRASRASARFSGLVNAVLRRLPIAAAEVRKAWSEPRQDMPDWLFARWTRAYGEAAAGKIAAASLERASLDITLKDPSDAAIEHWAARLGALPLSTGTLRVAGGGAIPDLPGYGDEAWWVQDVAAALPAKLLGDVKGLRVADLCAAPGGKTAQLAAAGAEVTAVDQSPTRLARLRANMERLGLGSRVAVVAADVATYDPPEAFDIVVLDAPCTATGTIRRHPDILHLKQPEDLERLASIQRRLLSRAAGLVKPGGRLLYCTCSLEPEEGPEQVARLLSERGDVQRVGVSPEGLGADPGWFTPQGELRTFPYHAAGHAPEAQGMDGFYAAVLRRAA